MWNNRFFFSVYSVLLEAFFFLSRRGRFFLITPKLGEGGSWFLKAKLG